VVNPSANIPLVLLPAALPSNDAQLAAPTPEAVDAHVAYVYLFLVVSAQVEAPSAKMPLVLLPEADPCDEAMLAAPTPIAVDEQHA
jgi:hypothetical protein